jgi:hypothetical protein
MVTTRSPPASDFMTTMPRCSDTTLPTMAAWPPSWRTVERASWGPDVSVLASVETVRDARVAMARGYAAALVVFAFERESAYRMTWKATGVDPHTATSARRHPCRR